MKLRQILLSATCIVLAPFSMADALQGLQEKLELTDTLRAKFTQQVFTESGTSNQISQGEMWVKKPKLFRWDVETPFVQQIFVNEDEMVVFDVDLDQAIVKSLSDKLSDVPAHLLSGDTTLIANEYLVSESESVAGFAYSLTPKSTEALFESLEMGFNHANTIRYMKLIDNLGQTTVINFYNIEKNLELDSAVFEAQLTDAIDIIRQ